MSELRPYQSEAVEATKEWVRASISPCLIEAATGAGKSHIIASLANWLHTTSRGKRVLCLAPSAELVKQNHAKYVATGESASIFSASAGIKSTRHKVIFATPGTVKNAISRFCKQGADGFCAIVIDEAHTIAPTVIAIIDAMRKGNPNLRVIGLSATPFKLGKGYIYRIGSDNKANGDDVCRDPYFAKCTYRIDARSLIEQGYLTKPIIGAINSSSYDTSGLRLLPNGKFDPESVDQAFVGHGRKTAAIVADVVGQSQGRHGVVFFASTVRHAEEIMASLPPERSGIVTGVSADRGKILEQFEEKKLKYLVNVGVLTTGWDCPHVDVVAILRRTESVGLLQQIIGRGLRLSPMKRDCVILDYANNLETHCPDGDLFAPIIKAKGAGGAGEMIEAECPDCAHKNEFRLHGDYVDYQRDKHGYCLDVFGGQIQTEHGPLPAHYGRRCFGLIQTGPKGEYERCNYRWTGKECPHCGEVNDIAARFCYVCKGEIVDPNEKLVADFKAMKRDPTRLQTDVVISMTTKESISQRGNKTLQVNWVTPYRQFSVWFLPEATHSKGMKEYARFAGATMFGEVPKTITYRKNEATSFFEMVAYNQPADEEPAIKETAQ